MRLFIALEISPAMCTALAGLQTIFRQAGIRGNYSPEENFHLTLAFLGEVPDPDPVIEAMDSISPPPVITGISRGQSVPLKGSRMVSSTFSSSFIRKT